MTAAKIGVLVVDDDFMIAQMHATCVAREDGFEVLGSAHSCKQALAMAKEIKPELIVLDIYLPDRSGLEVVRGLRTAKLQCDVILITAAKERAIIEEAFQVGIFDYLVKPFRLERLQDSLRRYTLFRAQLASSAVAPDQGFVDQLKGLRAAQPSPASEAQTQKGIDARTLDRIQEVLRDATEPISSEQVAQLAGVSRSTARAYLKWLVEQGAASELLQYGVVGRPRVLFALVSSILSQSSQSNHRA